MIFEPQEGMIAYKAELRKPNIIWAQIDPEQRSLEPHNYQILNAEGKVIGVKEVLPHEAHTMIIVPEQPLDIRRVYFLNSKVKDKAVHCSFDGWFRELYSEKELGANPTPYGTSVRLFAPRAEQVKLYLYRGRLDTEAYQTIDMTVDNNGVWELLTKEDLHGVYYDFTIHGSSDPGNHFYEQQPVHFTDPYARVSDDTWGKARIWRRGIPATPLPDGIPSLEDVIAYEVHVQDFTDQLPVDDKIKGTFPAMIQSGLRNSAGEKIGFDYLIDLGINTVHLMPVQEYLHFPTDDWVTSFGEDPYMIEQGIAHENYQWGYRTSHFMAVESRYRTKGTEPGQERQEFKELVQAFHDQDIAVIIDIVPNHTAENMDGNGWFFNFNAIDQQYYYRTKDFDHIGAYGNEVKTENRPMVQRWLIDQCQHFINEFGIDGFRIDLAGQIDQQTLMKLKKAIGDDKILYGEAWIGSNDPEFEDNPDWDWYKNDAPITFFQDDTRNAYKGPVFELKDPKNDRGWPGGKFEDRQKVIAGLANKNPDDYTPLNGISYLDIHDNFALADQFGVDFDGRTNVLQGSYKIAATLLYTTLGPIVTHGGSEIMRSKAHAPLREEVRTTQAGYEVHMHGYRDTYNHRIANQFNWEQVGQQPKSDNQNDYKNMHQFWRGLNHFRSSELGKTFRVAESVSEDYYQWILPEDEAQLGYIVNDRIMVLINASDETKSFDFPLTAGPWKLIGDINEIDHVNGITGHDWIDQLEGDQHYMMDLDPKSLFIWIKS